MNAQQPIFILGNPRSGTSLLRLILTSHSEILIPPECGFIVWLYDKYRAWTAEDAVNSAVRGQYLKDLFECKKFETWSLQYADVDTLIQESPPQNYADLCATVCKAYGKKHSYAGTIWGDKNNFYVRRLHILNEIYPKARFLHIVRDGRDVACSYREVMQHNSASPYAPKLSNDISSIASEWSKTVLTVDNFMAGLNEPRKFTIRYEELVRSPELSLSNICNWLELSYESHPLEFYKINRRVQLEPAMTMDWKARTTEPISADTVGRYNALLSDEEREIFALIGSDALARFFYTP